MFENYGMKKIGFIIHGEYIGKLRLIHKIEDYFANDYRIEIFKTQKSHQSIELTLQAVENKCDYIIACGGDGTVSEMINSLMNLKTKKRQKIVAGIFPVGTGNDFARTIGATNSMKSLHELISKEKIKPIDVGEISFLDFSGQQQTRFFNNIADIGLGADTVKRVNESSKILGGNLTFLTAVLQSFTSYKHKKVRITCPELQWEGEIVSLCMANGKYFGSGLGIAPFAEVDNGLIELAIIGKVSRFDFIRKLPALKKAKPIKMQQINYHKVSSCLIETFETHTPLEADGEYIGTTPVKAQMHHDAIRFFRT